ncbi:hypothetical protein CBR_g5710 [Chara braunii]|uniref:Integrase zinc-binding domain-containing protein n=1 Tax=Chara braunii TaxID=69332 RepID=A0A388KJ98_CHABU|nr:hypothetical protein CBR_g5710 [Chara braunii]|eukprot:GBG70078.1 hypothetical protein CBR_g5710 [Chara braunii]
MDGNIYDQFGEAIDIRLEGVRAEAQRRAAAGLPPPAMFRLWQEKGEPPIGVEEVGSDEEVTQGLRGESKREESITIESDDENEEERMEPSSVLLGKMEDLLDKMGRYQQKLVGQCDEVRKWKSNIPKVFLYDFGPESAPERPREGEAVENTAPVDGFLDQEEDVRLHINKWSSRVPSCVGYPIWQAPNGYERRADLVLKPFEEEDPWGGKDVQWMMELALASSHSLVEDMRTIEEGPGQVERHEDLIGGMYLIVNTLLQDGLDQSGSLNPTGNVDEVPESQDDEFEEKEIKEVFRAEEYGGIYLERGLRLSCEMLLRDASDRAQRMVQRYLVRDDHLFVRREAGNPRSVVCGKNRQIDVVAALHDGIAGGHRGVQATSDFTKTVMRRGGKGTRPPQRPLGASGGYERHGPHHRESTPVYDDGDIELFLDGFWEHARRMGWIVAQAIERLREAGRFEEPIARIRREATTRQEVETRMEELRPSPVGPDGRPIRLEIENVADFIPAFEWFMQGQGIPRNEWARTLPLWTRKAERALAKQVRDMARDWESCRAHPREAFRRPEPPQPRVERRQRSRRQRDPEPREARPSRGGRKTLARREEEPEPEPDAEERGAYPECGLGPVEFHRFTEAERRQEPPMGRVILEPEEAKAQRQAEREVFEFRAPTELATLPVAAAGPVVPLAVEEGLPPSSSKPAQGSAEGSMSVLLETVHTMQEEVSLFSPEQRIEEPLEREMGIEAEGAIEEGLQRLGTPEYGPEEIEEHPIAMPGETLERRPQRLDTHEYVPVTGDLRSRLGFWATGSGSGGPVPETEQQEVVSTAAPRSEQQGVVSTLV